MRLRNAAIAVLLISAVVIAAVSGSSNNVRFMQVGDPQLGKACDSPTSTHPRYFGLTHDECVAAQRRNLHGLLQYAEDTGITHVIFMGDQTENVANAYEEAQFAAEVGEHPNLTFHYVIGNHEVRDPCDYMPEALIDHVGLGRVPHWEYWSIGYVHFFSMNSMLTSYYVGNCYGLDDGLCVDAALDEHGACDDDPTDAAGQGSCASDQACRRWEDYAVAQEAALTVAIESYKASDGKAFFTISHHPIWINNNADVDGQDDGIWNFHNMRTCTSPVGQYCNDMGTAGQDCGGVPGNCTVDVTDRQWRSQYETILDGLGELVRGLFGHIHRDLVYSGTTQNGVDYYFVSSAGTSVPYPYANYWDDLTGNVWTCDRSGACTYETILAMPQSVKFNGAKLIGIGP